MERASEDGSLSVRARVLLIGCRMGEDALMMLMLMRCLRVKGLLDSKKGLEGFE